MGDTLTREQHKEENERSPEVREREEEMDHTLEEPSIDKDVQESSSIEAAVIRTIDTDQCPSASFEPSSCEREEETQRDKEFYNTPCKLHIILKSTQTTDKRSEEVTLPSYPRRGIDLKKHIESRYHIPTCVQQIKFYGVDIEDSTILRTLRLQHGDTLHIQYTISVDIEYFSSLISTLTRINEILEVVIPELLDSGDITDEMHDLIEGDCLAFTGDSIPLQYFSVYPTGIPNANQLYFIHNNGLQLLLDLYRSMHRLPWHWLPIELQQLEFSCLQIIWNFSATLGIRQLILQNGVMEEVFQSLMRTKLEPYKSVKVLDPLRDPYASLERSTYMLAETIYAAIVVVGNFAEVPQCRVPIASSSGVLSNMISAMLSKTYTFTCARSGMCALLCLSFSPETHEYLSVDSLLERIIEICNRVNNINDGTGTNEKIINKTLVEFYALIFFANLIHHWSSATPLSPIFLSTVRTFMSHYISTVTYDIIQQRMQEKRYYWSTFIPFLSLCYSPKGTIEGRNAEDSTAQSLSELHRYCIQAGLLSMKCMSVSDNAEEVIAHEDLVDYIVCVPWFLPDQESRSSAVELVNLTRRSLERLQPPSLTNIVKGFLASHYCGLEKTLKKDAHSILLEMDQNYVL